jgi:hypothetical protein
MSTICTLLLIFSLSMTPPDLDDEASVTNVGGIPTETKNVKDIDLTPIYFSTPKKKSPQSA